LERREFACRHGEFVGAGRRFLRLCEHYLAEQNRCNQSRGAPRGLPGSRGLDRVFGPVWLSSGDMAIVTKRVLLTIAALSSVLAGCNFKQTWLPSDAAMKKMQSDYDAALMDATNSIPYAAGFIRLFPGAASFFSYYTGGAGSSSLNMEIYLFARYQLAMKIPVTFDQDRRKVTGFGEPEFLLLEISEIGRVPNGNLYIKYNAEGHRRFRASEWKQIIDSAGNFSVIGYTFITNNPVPGFEDLRTYEEMRMKKQP